MIFVSTTSLENHPDAVKTIQRLIEAGITNIELGADHKYPCDTDMIIKMKKEFGLKYTVHAFFPPTKNKFMLNIGSANNETLRETIKIIKNAVELCNKAEAELYSMHCGYLVDLDAEYNETSKEITSEKCRQITGESVAEIADYAKRYGINVAVENHTPFLKKNVFTRPTEILSLIKEIKASNAGLLVDLGHLNVSSKLEGFDKKKEIDSVKDRIFEFHISENNGERDEHKPLTCARMIECVPKDVLRDRIATVELLSKNIEGIKKSAEIIENFI